MSFNDLITEGWNYDKSSSYGKLACLVYNFNNMPIFLMKRKPSKQIFNDI